jgi:hypothetical protein
MISAVTPIESRYGKRLARPGDLLPDGLPRGLPEVFPVMGKLIADTFTKLNMLL